MTRRAALIVVALIAAALVGVALLGDPGLAARAVKPTLGLDLQGGLEVTLQAVPPRDRELTKEDLDRSVTIMRNRVDRLGVSEPEIRTQGDDQIAIQLPGVKDPEAAARIIGKTAQLELFDLEANLVGAVDQLPDPPADRDREALRPARRPAGAGGQGEARRRSISSSKKGRSSSPGRPATREAVLGSSAARSPQGHKLFAVPPGTVVISCAPDALVCPGAAEARASASGTCSGSTRPRSPR